jgi:hypothetical protein
MDPVTIMAIYGCVIFLVLAGIFITIFYSHEQPKQPKHASSADTDKVCMTTQEYRRLMSAKACPAPPAPPQAPPPQTTQQRDYRVLADPLYPPLNRTDADTHTSLQYNIANRTMNIPTQDHNDTFRLVGYLTNKDATQQDVGGNTWKLFARQKDRHTSDFYMVPANKNYDVKIHVKDDMIQGERLRDLYTIPNSITFKSSMLNDTPYEFIEIPKSDLTSANYL